MGSTTVQGFTIFDGVPPGAAGVALNDNFTLIAGRSGPLHEHAGIPDASDDSVNTNGNGVVYKNSLWRDTGANAFYICIDDTATAAIWVQLSGLALREYTFCLRGSQTIGAGKTNTLIASATGVFWKSSVVAVTGPTGADFIIDINKNGTTIYDSTKLIIAAGATTGSQNTFTGTFVSGDLFTLDINQIGSTIPGSNLTVILSTLVQV